jgi:integrase
MIAPAEAPPTLHAAVRAYGQWRTGVGGYSPATWAGEQPGLAAFADYCAGMRLTRFWHLSDRVLNDYWTELQKQVTEATAVTRLHQLRSFLAYAQRKGWIDKDPTADIRAPRPRPQLRERLDARELLTMVETADFPQHRIVLALCANLALRQSELKRLLVRDVNLDAGTIRVTVHKTRDTPPHDMPITAELDVELRRWLAHYQSSAKVTASSLLVPSQHVSPLKITYRTDRSVGEPEDIVKRALAAIGWTDVKGEGIHTVRRSVARLYFDSVLEGGDGKFDEALLGCMRLLHHQRAETTLTYIGVDRQSLALDNVLRGKPFLTRMAGTPVLPALSIVR